MEIDIIGHPSAQERPVFLGGRHMGFIIAPENGTELYFSYERLVRFSKTLPDGLIKDELQKFFDKIAKEVVG